MSPQGGLGLALGVELLGEGPWQGRGPPRAACYGMVGLGWGAGVGGLGGFHFQGEGVLGLTDGTEAPFALTEVWIFASD